jgi:hypothetical protein
VLVIHESLRTRRSNICVAGSKERDRTCTAHKSTRMINFLSVDIRSYMQEKYSDVARNTCATVSRKNGSRKCKTMAKIYHISSCNEETIKCIIFWARIPLYICKYLTLDTTKNIFVLHMLLILKNTLLIVAKPSERSYMYKQFSLTANVHKVSN